MSRDRANASLMIGTAQRLGVEAGSVPLTVIGSRAWVGYLDDANTGREIAARIAECLERGCPDEVGPAPKRETKIPETLHLPLFGEVRTANLSLPALTALLAAPERRRARRDRAARLRGERGRVERDRRHGAARDRRGSCLSPGMACVRLKVLRGLRRLVDNSQIRLRSCF